MKNLSLTTHRNDSEDMKKTSHQFVITIENLPSRPQKIFQNIQKIQELKYFMMEYKSIVILTCHEIVLSISTGRLKLTYFSSKIIVFKILSAKRQKIH